jgi:hypothetical protein
MNGGTVGTVGVERTPLQVELRLVPHLVKTGAGMFRRSVESDGRRGVVFFSALKLHVLWWGLEKVVVNITCEKSREKHTVNRVASGVLLCGQM